MSDVRTAGTLMRCPDCGGILEPHRPAWADTIDVTAGIDVTGAPSAAWCCLLCGYQDRDASGPLGVAAPDPGTL